jgi:hypothetical protein
VDLQWSDQPQTWVTGGVISAVAGSANEIIITLDAGFTGNRINTGGTMRCRTLNRQYPTDTVFSAVADRAAPVIDSARFSLCNSDNPDGTVDTLWIRFSEAVHYDSVALIDGFNLLAVANGVPYTFDVTAGHRIVSQNECLFYGMASGVDYPQRGDSIWLKETSHVTDFEGNKQSSPLNRRVAVDVKIPTFTLGMFRIVYGPNPLTPGFGNVFVVQMHPNSRFPIPLDTSLVHAVIYDKVGNPVVELPSAAVVQAAQSYYELKWDGTNKRKRTVGNGTYALILYYNNLKNEPIMVGIQNMR